MSDNPYIDPYNHFTGYDASIEKLKNNPDLYEYGRLCYELFAVNEQGKIFMKKSEDRVLLPSLVHVNSPNFQIACLWAEGYKQAYRDIKLTVESHAQRLKMENKSV